MKTKNIPTRRILIAFVIGFFVGTILNVYFLFKPSNYNPLRFDPRSFWDWSLVITEVLCIMLFFLVARNVKNYGSFVKKLKR